MCGIAGVWERSGQPVDPTLLERMGSALVHRGPDGSGTYVRADVGLVNRRLRILDLSPTADQPLGLAERGLWLTYNGEIHNYVELRQELEALGVAFRTRTDTEVVLNAYATWGSDCFERFNGMWAVALWDEEAQELVLSRDRFGIKPLTYSVRGGRVAFASEPKAILAVFPEEREPDRAEIGAFLGGSSPDAGEATFFANVKSVPPATCLVFTRESSRRAHTWSFVPGAEAPRADAEEQFRELLRDAVRVRMRSDVPVGACLSGGLDSSAIVRLMPEPGGEPRHCFSLRYDDPRLDESRYASLAAGDGPIMHWVRPRGDDLLGTMRKIVWHHDAPTPVRGRVAHWFVMEEAARHVKVVLDGQGGDELLAGYAHFVLPYLVDRLRSASPWGLGRELARLGELESRSRLWFLLRTPLPWAQRALGLPPWVAGNVQRRDARQRVRRPTTERPYSSWLNNALWQELRHEGLPEVLHAEDALSMAFSVESRTPFLDHRLVELCFSLPFQDKIADGWTKSLLRRALADVVPQEILQRRRKLGFPAPVGAWLKADENWRDVQELLLDRRCLERGIFDARKLERALKAFQNGPALYRAHRVGRVWRWITLELWFRDFVDSGLA